MTEPDVAITDYLVGLEAAVIAILIWSPDEPGSALRVPFGILFGATAVAALAGGTVHGFLAGSASVWRVVLWRTVLLALGVAAYAMWTIGAAILIPAAYVRHVQAGAAILALGYAVLVVTVDDRFPIAIAHYAPAAVFLLAAFAFGAATTPARSMIWGFWGMLLTLVAAVVQLRQIALHRRYFSHNALYHAIQGVALLLIFQAAKGME